MYWCLLSCNTTVTEGVPSTVRLDSHGNFTSGLAYHISLSDSNSQQRYDVSSDIQNGLQDMGSRVAGRTVRLQRTLNNGWRLMGKSEGDTEVALDEL